MTDKKRPCGGTQDQKGDENSPTALYPDSYTLSSDDEKALWEVYHQLHLHCIRGGLNEDENTLWKVWHLLEDTLTKMGVLEADEEDEEEEEEPEEDPAGAYADYLYDLWKDRQIMAQLEGREEW